MVHTTQWGKYYITMVHSGAQYYNTMVYSGAQYCKTTVNIEAQYYNTMVHRGAQYLKLNALVIGTSLLHMKLYVAMQHHIRAQ